LRSALQCPTAIGVRVCYRIIVLRRQIKRLAAIAAERAVQAESVRAAPNIRPLTEVETRTAGKARGHAYVIA
jgi:hypothetical protein